ncbi:hypothetical protein Tco_0128208 [Tanacetum coccineum]
MHIRKDPSFFFTNRTGAPQGEELGLMKPLSVLHPVPNRFKTPLVEWVVYPTMSQEKLQEILEQLAHLQVVSL